MSSVFFFFSRRRRHTSLDCDWSSDVCSSDLTRAARAAACAAACLALGLACTARGGASRPREFTAERAFGYLQQQMQFGPRIPGTPGHERTGDFILEHLRATADTVAIQSFTHVTRHGATLHLRNFFARFRSTATERVLLLAHWDTRPHADQSANLGQQRRSEERRVGKECRSRWSPYH